MWLWDKEEQNKISVDQLQINPYFFTLSCICNFLKYDIAAFVIEHIQSVVPPQTVGWFVTCFV